VPVQGCTLPLHVITNSQIRKLQNSEGRVDHISFLNFALGVGISEAVLIWYIFNCNWVATRWLAVQYTYTHKQYTERDKTNNKYNTKIRKSAGRAPSLRVLPWRLVTSWRIRNTILVCGKIFSFLHTHLEKARGPTQLPVQWVQILSPGVKWPETGDDHPQQSSAEVKHGYSYTPCVLPITCDRALFTFTYLYLTMLRISANLQRLIKITCE